VKNTLRTIKASCFRKFQIFNVNQDSIRPSYHLLDKKYRFIQFIQSILILTSETRELSTEARELYYSKFAFSSTFAPGIQIWGERQVKLHQCLKYRKGEMADPEKLPLNSRPLLIEYGAAVQSESVAENSFRLALAPVAASFPADLRFGPIVDGKCSQRQHESVE